MTVIGADPNDPKVKLIHAAAGVIVESQAQPHTAPGHWAGALWEAGLLIDPGRLNGHGLVAALHDRVCPKRRPHGSDADPCAVALTDPEGRPVYVYDLAEAVRDYLRGQP